MCDAAVTLCRDKLYLLQEQTAEFSPLPSKYRLPRRRGRMLLKKSWVGFQMTPLGGRFGDGRWLMSEWKLRDAENRSHVVILIV